MRTLAELEKEAKAAGLDVEEITSRRGSKADALRDALMEHYRERDGTDLLPQVDVMLARDYKDLSPDLQRALLENKAWAGEEKYDGARFKMHFVGGEARFDSRRRSDQTHAFTEKSENFPHLTCPWYTNPLWEHIDPDESDRLEALYQRLEGTILDGEFLSPVDEIVTNGTTTAGWLHSTLVLTNSGRDVSLGLQAQVGPVVFIAFDILSVGQKDIRHRPFKDRRALLEQLVRQLNLPYLRLSRIWYEDHDEQFQRIVERGGEGMMFKYASAPYEAGKRSKYMLKRKRVETIDGYVSGWKPGQHGFTGLVGALEIVQMTPGGVPLGVAAVSSFPLELRREMTSEDGSLKKEYYGLAVEIRYQQAQEKSGRGRHAQLVRFRSDIPREERLIP